MNRKYRVPRHCVPRAIRAVVRTVAVLLALAPATVAAQQPSTPFAFLIYAEGYDLSIFRNGELQTYDVLVDDVVGMPLLAGDLVQTDARTFVEIQLMSTRTVLRVAENTTFEIERIGSGGGGSIQMTYGRVRARVERISRDDSFQIRGFSAVAGVRGTDFGYDMVVERDVVAELQTRVYVFEGEVEVETVAPPEEPTADGTPREAPPVQEPVRLTRNEMVQVTTEVPESVVPDRPLTDISDPEEGVLVVPPAGPRTVAVRRQQLEESIGEFWSRQDFRVDPVDPAAVEQLFPGINARVQQLSDERRQFEELQRLRRQGQLPEAEQQQAAQIEELPQRPPAVAPVTRTLQPADPAAQVRRLISPEGAPTRKQQLRTAGRWFVGAGIAMELLGLGIAYTSGDVRYATDLELSSPATAVMAGGGIFITSGLLSLFLSAIAP